jgi:sarcosine oxidase subunit gamma
MRDMSIAGRVELRELPFVAQIDVRLAPGSPEARRVEAVLGGPLPLVPNTVAATGSHDILWLGPDEWLATAPEGAAGPIEHELRRALEGGFGSVVDVSANRAVLELAGPLARDVLSTCCTLDLHPRTFGPGRCAQTLLAKAQVIIQQIDDRPAYRLFVRPSFGAYVVGWLREGIRAIAGEESVSPA